MSVPLTVAPPLRGKKLEMHARDERVLALAQRIFIEEGLQAVSIDVLAKRLGFSRGTLYQRFQCKEELLLELAIRCHEQLTGVLARAGSCPGRPRECMVAMGAGIARYATLYADNLRILAVIDSEMVLEKAPAAQLQRLGQAQRAMLQIPRAIAERAVEVGDLVLPPRMTVGALCMALASLISGWAQLQRRLSGVAGLESGTPLEDILRSAHLLMDGFGWRPFFYEWDYEQVFQEVGRSLLETPIPGLFADSGAPRGKEGAAP